MQGGAIELAAQARTQLAETGPPDVILATDMVNLPAWLGLLRRDLPAHIPVVLYMHENQLTYPWREGEAPRPHLRHDQLAQPACGRPHLLQQPVSPGKLVRRAAAYAQALPGLQPPVAHRRRAGTQQRAARRHRLRRCSRRQPETSDDATRDDAPLIVWNQRWEYDKRPDRFFALLERLHDAELPFRLAVAGENFRNVPEEFEAARARLGDRIVHWGYVESRQAYADLLRRADLVISTADHEFFGISVLEAICAGAYPLLPDRLSYPELLPDALHASCLYADEEDLFEKTMQRLADPRPAPPFLRHHAAEQFDWSSVARRYDDFLSAL